MMLRSLAGKVFAGGHPAAPASGTAVVTGAGRGLGRELALMLAERGHRVLVTDVDADSAHAVAAEIGERARALRLDVRDAEACLEAATAATEFGGKLSVWVNNAGVLATEPAWQTDADTRRLIMEVNALGTMNGSLAALESMHASGGGQIVNIASMAGIVAVPSQAAYAASKHAAVGFTLSLAADLRIAGRTDVALSVVCPDGIWTPMLFDRLHDPEAALSFSAKLLQPGDVVDAVRRVLERPRQVTAVPGWRLPLMRLADSFPELAFRAAPLIMADAQSRQRRYARRLTPARRASTRETQSR